MPARLEGSHVSLQTSRKHKMHRISKALGNDGEPVAGESERHSLGHATSEVRPRSRVHGLRFESGDIGGIDVCWFGGTILSGHGAAEGAMYQSDRFCWHELVHTGLRCCICIFSHCVEVAGELRRSVRWLTARGLIRRLYVAETSRTASGIEMAIIRDELDVRGRAVQMLSHTEDDDAEDSSSDEPLRSRGRWSRPRSRSRRS